MRAGDRGRRRVSHRDLGRDVAASSSRPLRDGKVPEDPRRSHSRQPPELLELSTPVTRLWDGVLAVPLVGTLDSARTQVVMESLLEDDLVGCPSIGEPSTSPGVPTVDALVAQHLLEKTVAAAKPHGGGIHHQRHSPADGSNDRPPRRRSRRRRERRGEHLRTRPAALDAARARRLPESKAADAWRKFRFFEWGGCSSSLEDSGRPARAGSAAAARGPRGADRQDGRERRAHRASRRSSWWTRSSAGAEAIHLRVAPSLDAERVVVGN